MINRPLLNDIKKADVYIQQLYKKVPFYMALQNKRSRVSEKGIVVIIGWCFTWGMIYILSFGVMSQLDSTNVGIITSLVYVLFIIFSIILVPILHSVLGKLEKKIWKKGLLRLNILKQRWIEFAWKERHT